MKSGVFEGPAGVLMHILKLSFLEAHCIILRLLCMALACRLSLFLFFFFFFFFLSFFELRMEYLI